MNASKVQEKLARLPRYNVGSYGGMIERADGAYFSAADVLELIAELGEQQPVAVKTPATPVRVPRSEFQMAA